MKKARTKAAALLCAVCVITSLLCSCAGAQNGQTKELAQPLIEASILLDKILYGEGLEVSEEKEGKYSKVSAEGYESIGDIRDRCAEVYTAELCEVIENSVLRGKTGDEGTSYAKYIEIEGVLYKYDNARIYITHPRRFDFDSIKTKSFTDKRVIFTIDTYAADEEGNYSSKAEQLEMKLIYDDSFEAWRLDTPTF